jgi:alpha-mannosidase
MQYGLAQPFFTQVEQKIASDSPVWDYKSIAKGYTFPKLEEG